MSQTRIPNIFRSTIRNRTRKSYSGVALPQRRFCSSQASPSRSSARNNTLLVTPRFSISTTPVSSATHPPHFSYLKLDIHTRCEPHTIYKAHSENALARSGAQSNSQLKSVRCLAHVFRNVGQHAAHSFTTRKPPRIHNLPSQMKPFPPNIIMSALCSSSVTPNRKLPATVKNSFSSSSKLCHPLLLLSDQRQTLLSSPYIPQGYFAQQNSIVSGETFFSRRKIRDDFFCVANSLNLWLLIFWAAVACATVASQGRPARAESDYTEMINNYSIDEIQEGAEAGDARAQFVTGVWYIEGDAPDYPAAVYWLEQARGNGIDAAIPYLANLYAEGLGTSTPEPEMAINMLKEAAEKGSAECQAMLGMLYFTGSPEFEIEKNIAEAFKWNENAALNGDANAQYLLGEHYFQGLGTKQNSSKAAYLFQRAAEQGHPVAQVNIGSLLYEGVGLPKNHEQAAQWFLRAAEAGTPEGMFNAGICLEKGHGVQQDLKKAAELWERAADANYGPAQTMIAMCYLVGQGVQKDILRAHEWLQRAAMREQPTAFVALGEMYASGNGEIRADAETARLWFNRALVASPNPKSEIYIRATKGIQNLK